MKIELKKIDLKNIVEKFSAEKNISPGLLEEFVAEMQVVSDELRSIKKARSGEGRELALKFFDLWKENTGTELVFDWGPGLGTMKRLLLLLEKSGIDQETYLMWLINNHRNTIVKYGISMVVPLLNEYKLKNRETL